MAYEGYAGIPGARIQAVCDADEGTARRRAAEWGVKKWHTDYRRLLEDPDVDAVEILTPHATHVGICLDAMGAGKHLALQKPMTVDRAEAEKLVAASANATTVCKVTENYVFYPPIRFASQIIREGWIGAPSSISIKLIAGGKGGWPVPPSAWAWRVKEFAQGRGMQTFDHGHHLWSTARSLLGPIEKVSAWIGTTASVIDSPAAIMWKHRDGDVFGLCEYVYGQDMEIPSRYYANDEWIQVSGSAGILRINRCTGELLGGPSVSLYAKDRWREFRIPSDWKLGFKGSAWNFIRAIRGEEKPRLSFQEGMEILSIDLAIARSSQAGREVRLKPDGAMVPAWAAHLAGEAERRKLQAARRRLKRGNGSGGSEDTDIRAVQLTRELPLRARDPQCPVEAMSVGLVLSGPSFPGGTKRISLLIRDGEIDVEEDVMPDEPNLTIRTDAKVWADILSKAQSIEAAYLQGRLKLEGSVERALSLKKLFRL